MLFPRYWLGVLTMALVLPASPQAYSQNAERAAELLKRFPQADANQDGRLTREEMKAFRESRRAKKKPGQGVQSPIKRYRPDDMAKSYQALTFEGMPYRFLKPPGYEKKKDTRYPLILSLHGAGGRGDDNLKNLKVWNGVMMEKEFQRKYPCFIVVPQSVTGWRIPGTVPKLTQEQIKTYPDIWQKLIKTRRNFYRDDPKAVLDKTFKLLDKIEKDFPIDPDRVYVLGHSMGGFGSFEAVAQQPKRFAAAIPSAGGLMPWHDVSKFRHVPIWAFHGDLDKTVPMGLSQAAFDALKKADGNMKFTTLAGVGHGANAFAFVYTGDAMGKGFKTFYTSDVCDKTSNVWDWLFAQKRTKE